MVDFKDCLSMFEYLNQFVKIKLKEISEPLFGWLYTVDPVSKSYVIVEFDKETPKEVIVIMIDEIEDVSLELQENVEYDKEKIKSELNRLFSNKAIHEHEESSLIERRNDLIEWLKKNRLPVKLDPNNVINILDSVFIQAPYELDDCQSTNEIILDKVRQLVQSLPVKS